MLGMFQITFNVSFAIEDIVHFVREQEAVGRTWSKEFFPY